MRDGSSSGAPTRRGDHHRRQLATARQRPARDPLAHLRLAHQNGFVSTIDVSYPLHAEHERKLHRWLYGDELKEVSPLPDFYVELQESFRDIAKQGGGADVKLGDDAALVNNVLVLAFGTQWKNEVGRVARGR